MDEQSAREFIERVQGLADMHVRTTRTTYGADLDYSIESLEVCDRMITECWPEPPVNLNMVASMFAAYLGETLRRTHGGEWGYSPQHGVVLVMGEGEQQATAMPINRVLKRFQNGEEDSLAYYATVIGATLRGEAEGDSTS